MNINLMKVVFCKSEKQKTVKEEKASKDSDWFIYEAIYGTQEWKITLDRITYK